MGPEVLWSGGGWEGEVVVFFWLFFWLCAEEEKRMAKTAGVRRQQQWLDVASERNACAAGRERR